MSLAAFGYSNDCPKCHSPIIDRRWVPANKTLPEHIHCRSVCGFEWDTETADHGAAAEPCVDPDCPYTFAHTNGWH